MKRFIFPFLIIALCSVGATASGVESRVAQRPDSLSVRDSLNLFRDITDVSRQIERRTAQPKEASGGVILSPPKEFVSKASLNPTPLFRNPLDSIYSRKENGTLQLPDNFGSFEAMIGLTFVDTLFYNPLFLPMIFTGEILPRKLSLYSPDKGYGRGSLIPRGKTFAPLLDHVDFVRNVRRDYYMKYPDKIRYSVTSFDSVPRLQGDDQVVKEIFNPLRGLIKTETTYSLEAPGVEGATIGRKYWVYSGEHSFQFAQNYFSNNWHKGGTNNLNVNSYHLLRADYRREKVRFNNTLEWRLSVFNAPDDSLRRYRIGNDLIRYYGDFGVDAFGKGWSYSTNLEAKSQLFNAYPANSNDLRSSFLSPLYVNAGAGLTYILDRPSAKVRHRKVRWELTLAPISINYTYVWDKNLDVKRFGVAEGKRSQLDIGSTLTSIFKYDITRYITWDSRLTYFTSYRKALSEFENSLNMALSNTFSTRIYVNMRFDDGVPPDPTFKYLQVNQTLSFGLNYKW